MQTEELYFNATLRYSGFMQNNGFLIVRLEEGKIVKMSGLFTNDLITHKIDGDTIVLTFYTMDYESWTYCRQVSIEINNDAKKSLPLKAEKSIGLYVDGKMEKSSFQIETNYKILDEEEKRRCNEAIRRLLER